jgi:hypothetical protein
LAPDVHDPVVLQFALVVQLVVLGSPALHLLIGPQPAWTPDPVHAAPVLVPVWQVPAVLHCAAVVQLVVLGNPALHLLIPPQATFAPFAEHAAPALTPVVQTPFLLQSDGCVHEVVLGRPAEHVPVTVQAALLAHAFPSLREFWHLFVQSATVLQLPPLVLAYWQVPLPGTIGQLGELAPIAQPVVPVVAAQWFGNGEQSVLA